jgi:hypothetical protein
MKRVVSLASLVCLLVSVVVGAVAIPSAEAEDTGARVWSVNEILSERKFLRERRKPRMCRGGAFKPCVCPKDVPSAVQYRPSVKECGGDAAIVLSGAKYMAIYSVVVRDWENKDRWPATGANGCSPYETNVLGLNKCSVFKVQKILAVENETLDAEIHCLGASGYSPLFGRVSRITAKYKDIPGSNKDPLARWCLAGASKPLN